MTVTLLPGAIAGQWIYLAGMAHALDNAWIDGVQALGIVQARADVENPTPWSARVYAGISPGVHAVGILSGGERWSGTVVVRSAATGQVTPALWYCIGLFGPNMLQWMEPGPAGWVLEGPRGVPLVQLGATASVEGRDSVALAQPIFPDGSLGAVVAIDHSIGGIVVSDVQIPGTDGVPLWTLDTASLLAHVKGAGAPSKELPRW